jgi:hypothetical protein
VSIRAHGAAQDSRSVWDHFYPLYGDPDASISRRGRCWPPWPPTPPTPGWAPW